MFRLRRSSSQILAAVGRRLLLGLLMAAFAIVAAWVLVPPEAGTDRATVEWYTQ